LSFLENGISAYSVEGIFNIKFEENFVIERLVHEVTGRVVRGLQLNTPRGCLQERLTEPWDEGSQADFSDKTLVGA